MKTLGFLLGSFTFAGAISFLCWVLPHVLERRRWRKEIQLLAAWWALPSPGDEHTIPTRAGGGRARLTGQPEIGLEDAGSVGRVDRR